VKEWNTLHFRSAHATISMAGSPSASNTTPVQRILGRLQGYETRLPPPPLRQLAAPVPCFPIPLHSAETLQLTLSGPLSHLQEMAQAHGHNVSAFGSLNCSYLELVPGLWVEEEVQVHVAAACKGSTVGRERRACCGPALVPLSYMEAKKQEGVASRLAANRKSLTEVESRLLATTPAKYVVAASVASNILHRVLLAHEKDLGRGKVGGHFQLACTIFQLLAQATTESVLAVPPLRHFFSTCLDTVAAVIVTHWADMAACILDLLVAAPHLAPMLTHHFSPQVGQKDGRQQLAAIYAKISQLPDGDHGSLPFVLLSKLDFEGWLAGVPPPTAKEVNVVVDMIVTALRRTGQDPAPPRQMIHGLHRKQLFQIFLFRFPAHYSSILRALLCLSANNQARLYTFFN
jgi:hypothetical protein